MSGFEVAGIVLGSIPLLISALEHYRDGIAVMKNMKEYEYVFSDIHTSFAASLVIYTNSCYQLLNPLHLPDQLVNDLLQERKREAWMTPQLQKDLEKRLGPDYEIYLSLVDKLNRKILLFCKALRLNSDFKPQWIRRDGTIDEIERKKFFKNPWTRIRGGFNSDKCAACLEDIDNKINKISKLTAGAMQLEPLRAEKKNQLQSTYWKNIRDKAHRLSETLSSQFHPCSYHLLHRANLRLDIRTGDGIEDAVRFALLFAFEKPSCGSKTYPWDWRDIEIETSQCSNSPATIAPQPALEWISSESARFAPPITISPSAPPQLGQCLSLPDLASKIDNFCNTLMQGYHSKCCLGFLEDQPWQHHVYWVPGPGTCNQFCEVVPLEEMIWVNKSTMAVREKCILAYTLANAVLQLHNTPWLPKNWDTKDIFLLKPGTGSALPPQIYVSQTFNSTAITAAKEIRRRCVKNEVVFALGVALLELSYGQPLLSLYTPEDLNEQGMEDSMTEVSIAMRLAGKIHEREMDNYAKAVLRCVTCNFDTFVCDFENREFREKFFEGVVVPLRTDYEYTTGWKA